MSLPSHLCCSLPDDQPGLIILPGKMGHCGYETVEYRCESTMTLVGEAEGQCRLGKWAGGERHCRFASESFTAALVAAFCAILVFILAMICLLRTVRRKRQIRRYFYADVEKKSNKNNNNLRREMNIANDNVNSREENGLKTVSTESGSEVQPVQPPRTAISTSHQVKADFTTDRRENGRRFVQIPETFYEEDEVRNDCDELSESTRRLPEKKSSEGMANEELPTKRSDRNGLENNVKSDVMVHVDNSARNEKVNIFSRVELESIAAAATKFNLRREVSLDNASIHAADDGDGPTLLSGGTTKSSLKSGNTAGMFELNQFSNDSVGKRDELTDTERYTDTKLQSRPRVASISQSIESKLSALFKTNEAVNSQTSLKKIERSTNVDKEGGWPSLPLSENALKRLRMTSNNEPQVSKRMSDSSESLYFGSDVEISSLKGEVHSHGTPQMSTSGETDGYTMDFIEEDDTLYEEYPVNNNKT